MGKAYVHTVIDDHSRVAYAEIHDDEAALTAAAVLVRPVSLPIHQCHSGASSVPPVARSADPEQFARNVATTLFAWDTTTGLLPLDYTSTILAVGDPSGAEQAGLANDVAAYLPSRAVWPGPA